MRCVECSKKSNDLWVRICAAMECPFGVCSKCWSNHIDLHLLGADEVNETYARMVERDWQLLKERNGVRVVHG